MTSGFGVSIGISPRQSLDDWMKFASQLERHGPG